MDIINFRKICILAGTDYSSVKNGKTVYYYYKLFHKFQKSNDTDLFEWLHKNNITRTIKTPLNELNAVYDLFNIQKGNTDWRNFTIEGRFDYKELRKLLEKNSFIFPPDLI